MKLRFIGGNVNPCLYVKNIEKGVTYLASCVDDNLIVGHPVAIDEPIATPKKHYKRLF